MPNTLGHLAVHGLSTRCVIPKADLAWIYLGCIISDVPWILQRAFRAVLPEIDVYALRLYAVNQASLFVSLFLCAGLALCLSSGRRVFYILGFGCFLHLVLDACQVKWANGVSFYVPFNWQLLRFDLFGPESRVFDFLTIAGLCYFFVMLRIGIAVPPRLSSSRLRGLGGIVLVMLYFLLPFLGIQAARKADNHYVATLESKDGREGKALELDRARYENREDGPVLVTFAGEALRTEELELGNGDRVSIRGRFVTNDMVEVDEYYRSMSGMRDLASYIGLFLIATFWAWVLLNAARIRRES